MLAKLSQIRVRMQPYFTLLLLVLTGSQLAHAQDTVPTPTIELKTDKAFIYSTGDRGIQPVFVTINNPTDSALREVEFTLLMSPGVVLGNLDDECDLSGGTNFVFLQCSILQVDANNNHLTDFYIDGPLSTSENGIIQIQLSTSSPLTIVEQTEDQASLIDDNRTVIGSELTLQHVRDILYDWNNNGIADVNEEILNPTPDQSWDAVNATQAVLDVLFLITPAAETYLGGQLQHRIDQLLTGTNEVYRENQIAISFRSLGVEPVAYTENELLEDTLDEVLAASDEPFTDVPDLVNSYGADFVVLLHALPSATDTFCAFSANNATGRQGDFQAALHRGRLITVLDVGPDCIDLPDLAASLSANMGIVASRADNPEGGTFSYSAGYAVEGTFRSIATRLSSRDLSATPDLNRFSNPDILCAGIPCGVTEDSVSQGANAVLSLNQTRHLVDALNDTAQPVPAEILSAQLTPTVSNGIDLQVSQSTVESGVLTNAYAEYQVSVTNTFSETVHDLNVTAFHLNNGFFDLSPQYYRFDNENCFVSGTTTTTTATLVDGLTQKSGRLNCFIDSLAPGESFDFNYFLLVDSTPPALDEEVNYYHEMIAINTIAQEESAVCIPVYTDLLDAAAGSGVCNTVNQLQIEADPGAGFLDLEALPTIDGNFITVPFIRLNDNTLISALFQVINFGQPELELVEFRIIEADLLPVRESRFDEDTGHLSIVAITLSEAVYNLEIDLVADSDPPRFENMVLIEIMLDE